MTRSTRAARLDRLVVVGLAWIVTGLFVDGWFHINGPGVETFFTPWHGIMYSGIGVTMAIVGEAWLHGRRSGRSWREALPTGYGTAAVAGPLFLVGGGTDFLWHTLLGIEVGVEALVSPSHLVLAVAGFLAITGPLRAAQHRRGARAAWTTVLAAGLLLSLLGFFTNYLHPLARTYAEGPTTDAVDAANLNAALGLGATQLQSAVLAGLVVVLLRRWQLPFGAWAVILGGSGVYLTSLRGNWVLLPGLVLAGLAADLVIARVPAPFRIRVGATVVPALVTLSWVVSLAVAGRLGWSVPLWSGAVVLSAFVGALIGTVAAAPTAPAPQAAAEDTPAATARPRVAVGA